MRITFGAMAYRGRLFTDGLDAAARAGYTSVGVSLAQIISCMERGMPASAMAQEITSRGLVVDELELIRLGGDSSSDRLWNEFVLETVDVFRPRRLHACAFGGDVAEVSTAFVKLCAETTDALVAFEFMPYGTVPGLQAGLDVVRAPGSPRARLVLDAFHFFRSGARFDELTPDVVSLIDVVQLSDLVPRPGIDLRTESRHLRMFPGDGTLPLVELLQTIRAGGGVPSYTLEPHSDALDAMPALWVAERGMQAMAQVLTAAGIPLPAAQDARG